ncbi:MarR family winged helix-turn-helix transcriptional regulator [Microbacterium sp. Marseille-Q6965]|uniref:MarR family winged helix-turn-helix transcriptional regulator n=1 Tax=Microbacterium sp. Marseille-Q6965 TaxID=2965072 RepID=UPI0021B7B291|nr:MarR family transcriptional regulator [Microbacterium sp. Marseille-Q6965]
MTPLDPADQIAAALARLRGLRPVSGRHDAEGPAHAHRGAGHHRGPMTWGATTPGDLRDLRAEIADRRGRGPAGGLGRSATRMRMLEVLVDAGTALSVGDLAARLHIDQPRASRVIQTAVHLGLARREADPRDARRTLIALTEHGAHAVAEARGARADAVQQALAGFTPDERAQLAALLTRLADAWPRPGR